MDSLMSSHALIKVQHHSRSCAASDVMSRLRLANVYYADFMQCNGENSESCEKNEVGDLRRLELSN